MSAHDDHLPARARPLRPALATALAALSGCCPIPMNDDVLVLPAATLVVRDASDRPVAGARILVHAEMQPHARDDDPTVEITTDADGRATLVERRDEMRVYPLMMHGVPGFSWSVCIEHPAHGAMAGPPLHSENPNEIAVVLKGETGKCEVAGSRATLVLEPTAKPPSPSESGESGPQGREDESGPQGREDESGPQGREDESRPQGREDESGPQGREDESRPQGREDESPSAPGSPTPVPPG